MSELEQFSERPDADMVIGLIASCIQSIWQGDEMFACEDYSQQELVDFVEQLSPANLDKIQKFFSTMPVLKHELSWKCKACEKDNTVVLEGLQNFFD